MASYDGKILYYSKQKCLITGHSFLPSDRDFAVIRAKKVVKVYIPQHHWIQIIANTNKLVLKYVPWHQTTSKT